MFLFFFAVLSFKHGWLVLVVCCCVFLFLFCGVVLLVVVVVAGGGLQFLPWNSFPVLQSCGHPIRSITTKPLKLTEQFEQANPAGSLNISHAVALVLYERRRGR